MPRDLSPSRPPPPPPSPTHFKIVSESDKQRKADDLRERIEHLIGHLHMADDAQIVHDTILNSDTQPRGDTKWGPDDSPEDRYRSGGREDESELDKSEESAEDNEGEEDDEDDEDDEDGVTYPRRPHPPSRPSISLNHSSHSKSPISQRNQPSCQRQPLKFQPAEDDDDENLDKSNWHHAQQHGSRPYFHSEPPHQTSSGPPPSVPRPVLSAPEPSGISRTHANATGQISSPVLSRAARHGSVRSTGTTSRRAGHHYASVAPMNSDQNRTGLHEQPTSSSANPHYKPNPSSLGEGVCFPVSVSLDSWSTHGLQRSDNESGHLGPARAAYTSGGETPSPLRQLQCTPMGQ
jgi:hypothetical protein